MNERSPTGGGATKITTSIRQMLGFQPPPPYLSLSRDFAMLTMPVFMAFTISTSIAATVYALRFNSTLNTSLSFVPAAISLAFVAVRTASSGSGATGMPGITGCPIILALVDALNFSLIRRPFDSAPGRFFPR